MDDLRKRTCPEENEDTNKSAECLYEKIIPEGIPPMSWFDAEESKNMEPLLLPVALSGYDTANPKFNISGFNKTETEIATLNESEVPSQETQKKRKRITKIFGKHRQQLSIHTNITDKDIPTKPMEVAIKYVKNRSLEEQRIKVEKLFQERPIWTKSAVLYNTGISIQHSKFVLPLVAYYFISGPWRSTWVRYGYDPRKDPAAKIYQVLDYRIRTAEGTKLKVRAKRTTTSTINLSTSCNKKVSLKDDISSKPRIEYDQRCYILQKGTIPPARQMFYQLCDIFLPEIQEMITRSPKNTDRICDPKSGWFPKNFLENCREIVNNYVLEAVKKELVEDYKVMEEKVQKQSVEQKKEKISLDYCSEMLSNIKRGIYKNVDLGLVGPSQKDINLDELGDSVDLIDLSDDEFETVNDIIESTLPERIDQDEEEEDDDEDRTSHCSDDPEIDLEVVEELKQILKTNEK